MCLFKIRAFPLVAGLFSLLMCCPAGSHQGNPSKSQSRSQGQILEGEAHFLKGDYPEAMKHWRNAIDLARTKGSPLDEGIARLRYAHVLYITGTPVDAMRMSREALNVSTQHGLDVLRCNALAQIGMIYRHFGRIDKALESINQALNLAKSIRDDVNVAYLFNQAGLMEVACGHYGKALEFFARALESANRFGDGIEEGHSLRNMAEVNLKLGRFEKALQLTQKAHGRALEIKDRRGLGMTLNHLGVVASRRGKYEEALKNYEKAIEVMRPLGDLSFSATILSNMASAYRDLGLYIEALAAFTKAIELYRKSADPKGEAYTALEIGKIQTIVGDAEKAQRYFELAQQVANAAKDTLGEAYAMIHLSRGMVHLFYQHSKPLEFLKDALASFRKTGETLGEASTLAIMGEIHNRIHKYEDACRDFERVQVIAEETGYVDPLWRALKGQGYALWKQRKKGAASEFYLRAIHTVEQIYENLAALHGDIRTAFVGGKRPLYEEFMDLLIELHYENPQGGYDEKAFMVAELTHSRQFAEMLAKASAKLVLSADSPIFGQLIEEERSYAFKLTYLRQSLYALLSRPRGERDETDVQALRSQIKKLEKALTVLSEEIAARFPRYQDLKAPKTITIEEVQALLSQDESLVAYFVTDQQMVAFVVTPKLFRMLPLFPDKNELRGLVGRFRQPFVAFDSIRELLRWDPQIALTLYKETFEEAEPFLQEGGTVFVVGDDVLYTLPFEALIRSFDKNEFSFKRQLVINEKAPLCSEYYGLDYLGDHYRFTYLPSAGALRSLRQFEKRRIGGWSETLAAFADPKFEETVDGAPEVMSTKSLIFWKELQRASGRSAIPRLPETAEEARAVAGVLRGKNRIYLRDQASERVLYEEDFRETRYLLFSTHGLLGGDFTGIAEPALVLSLVGNPPGIDGFVTMSEVLGLRLNADLVALSACNTAGEAIKAKTGEGFAGLTRSFMYAGARSLLVSHWPVHSAATVELIKLFFSHLKKGLGKAEALTEAKRELRKLTKDSIQYAHPFFWSPFVLVGDTR